MQVGLSKSQVKEHQSAGAEKRLGAQNVRNQVIREFLVVMETELRFINVIELFVK